VSIKPDPIKGGRLPSAGAQTNIPNTCELIKRRDTKFERVDTKSVWSSGGGERGRAFMHRLLP